MKLFERLGERTRQHVFIAASSVIIAVLAIVSVKLLLQNDTFYSIAIGKHIMRHGVDGIDPFSYHNLPYTYPHWLFDVAVYLIYHAFGVVGIYLATCILAVILGLLIYYACSKLSRNYIAAFVVTLVSLILLNDFLTARAQLATYILLLLAVYFIEQFLHTGRRRYAIGLVVIPAIIANVHAAVYPFYFILFLPYLVAGTVGNWFYKYRQTESTTVMNRLEITRQPRTKWLLVIMLLGLIAGLATPLGFTPYTYFIKTMLGSTTQYISEHQPVVLASTVLFTVTLIITGLVLFFTRFKVRLCDFLMIGGLFLMALSSNRHIALLALIGSIPATLYLARLLDNKHVKANQIIQKFTVPTAGLAMVVALVCVIVAAVTAPKLQAKIVDKTVYPVEATKYIKTHIDYKKEHIYNPYFIGSYLLYNDIPVFIDSRADLYDPKFNGDNNKNIFIDEHYINTLNHTYYEDIFKKYGISYAIVNKNSSIDIQLAHNKKYQRIYKDDNFIIYQNKLSQH